ncbi:hypothetical protein ACHAW5_009480 [Stephanodiscus triporus]|uniref:Uncharacterized protein n=1 Tax=Stephanodiscus triporus TaxID=2934178 RepID=A0ABD3QY85_9STRA
MAASPETDAGTEVEASPPADLDGNNHEAGRVDGAGVPPDDDDENGAATGGGRGGGGGGGEEVEKAAPQSREAAAAEGAARFGSTSSGSGGGGGGADGDGDGGGGDGEMYDLKLSPFDLQDRRQNLMSKEWTAAPPPLYERGNEDRATENGDGESALHRDEYSSRYYGGGGGGGRGDDHDPRNHESALGLTPSSLRRNARRIASAGGGSAGAERRGGKPGGRHSHPRKSPYRSEVARLRHAQQQQQQQAMGAEQPTEGGSTADGGVGITKSVSIKDTTAPPETAYFSIQAAKFKHSLLNSLGDFLTGAFADDEETSGSYYSQDLLDQLESSNPYLRGVWLQSKNLNDAHVQRLCDALIRNKVVTEVWLPSNHITDVGATHIAHMLKFNRHIKELFLGENDIGPKGAAALATALARGNNTLVALGLGDNHIGVEGAGAFAAALRHNHTLRTLDFKNNGIPRRSSIRRLLNKMLEFNSSDPGDESLVLGLQEELVKLVTGLPPDVAGGIVAQAEDALKMAMLCRRRGDKVGAAEAEGVFIRICTTGQSPVDPPPTGEAGGSSGGIMGRLFKRHTRPIEPDGVDASDAGMSTAKVDEDAEPTVDDKGDDGEKEQLKGS